MPATYNGNASNVTLSTAVSIAEPVDADAPNAASVNTPLSKLADYVEAIRSARSVHNFGNAGEPILVGGLSGAQTYFLDTLRKRVFLSGSINGVPFTSITGAGTTGYALTTAAWPAASMPAISQVYFHAIMDAGTTEPATANYPVRIGLDSNGILRAYAVNGVTYPGSGTGSIWLEGINWSTSLT